MRVLLCLFLFLGACTREVVKPTPVEIQTRTVYVQTPLPLPIKPEWPIIKGRDMRCLSPTTQWELKNRDTMMKEYISQLETIIRATHE